MAFNFVKDQLSQAVQTTAAKMAIEDFQSHIKDIIPFLHNVKKLEDQSHSPLINLEWYATQCSGKYGIFSMLKDHSSKRLDISDQSSVTQNFSEMSSKQILNSNQNVAAYSINQLKGILRVNEEEIRLLSKMRHENIITLLGVVKKDGSENLPLLVMEAVHCDLFYYLNNTNFITCNEDLIILQGICNGLVYLHEVKSIIHNNVSKHNILLTKNLVVKLSNFESAVKLHPCANKVTGYSADLFSLGEVISVILSLKYCDIHTTDEEDVKRLMLFLFELCTSTQLNSRSTSYDILKALNSHKKPVQKIKIEVLDEFKRLTEKNRELQEKLTAITQEEEENRFKLTNSFSKVDRRSAVKLSEEYKCIQHHDRSAAARAHKAAHAGCDPVPFHLHTMMAFEKAKELIFTAFGQYLEQSLFQLQKEKNTEPNEDQTLSVFRLMLNDFYEEHNLTESPTESIKKVLAEAYKNHVGTEDTIVPEQVKEYYEKLAKFTWTSVAKAIPMVPSVEAGKFDKTIHELKDDPEDDDDRQSPYSTKITYIYPTLFSSNNCPREVAAKGKVKLCDI